MNGLPVKGLPERPRIRGSHVPLRNVVFLSPRYYAWGRGEGVVRHNLCPNNDRTGPVLCHSSESPLD